MRNLYNPILTKSFLLLVLGIFNFSLAYTQTHTDTFDNGPDEVTSLSRTIGGVQFNFNFTASGTLANINAALDAATFTPTPNLFGTNAGTISFVSNDGTDNSNTASVTFDIAGGNNPPVVSNTIGNTFWKEGDPPTTVKPLIGVSDPDGDNIIKAIITNLLFVPGDELSVGSPGPYSVDYNTSTGVLTLSGIGTASEMQNALRTVGFRNSTDDPGLGNTRNTRILSIFVEDEHGAISAAVDNPGIFVTSVNDAPSIVAPPSIDAMEDVPKALTGISFIDPDAGSGYVTALFSVASGSLSAISASGVTVGGTSSSLVLVGSLSDINTFIANGKLIFTTALNATSDVNLDISISDNGNTGSGGGLADEADVTLSVTAVNDAPVNTVPGTQQTDQDAALVFSSGNENLISVSDVDAGSNEIQVTLTATNGLISLSGTGGLTFSQGSGVNDTSMMFVGTLSDISTALDGLIFSPIAGFNGLASLSITSNDQGFSGSGGSQTNTDVVSITVNSINPIVTLVTSTAANGTYKLEDELTVLVEFDQAVTVNTAGGSPILTLETGSTDREASYESGSGSNVLTFGYTVQQGDVSSDLDYTATNALVLNGATIENISGDAALISLPPVASPNSLSGQKDIQIDGVIPIIANVSVPGDGIYVAGETLDFTVNFSEVVAVTGNPEISINIGSETEEAIFVSGSGSSALVFSYTVQSGDLDDNGIVVGSFSLNGGTIRDAAGNNANLTLNSVGATDQVLVDAVAPNGYAVSFELGAQTIINSSNVETVEFEGSALEIGTLLSYEFSSSTSGTPITGTASVTSGTQIFDNGGTGYDLTALGDGTITLSISLTDDAGNVGADATTTVIKDATAPTGYIVAWDDLLINAIESSNTSFTISNSELDATVNYSISSSGDGNTATITGSLPVTGAVQQIPADVSALADGILTIEIALTDEGDNEGGIVSANNATLDQTAPANPSTPDLTDESDTGISNTDNITADNTPTFSGTAEANTSVEVFGEGTSLGTTAVDGSGVWSFTSPSFTDGTYAITATATDAAGNVSLPSAVLSIIIDQNECNAQADFILSPSEGCSSPLTVFFTDQSTLSDTWQWDFGDGSSSAAQNPIHTYNTYGDFTVKLTVTDTIYGCSSSIEKVISNYELSPDFAANGTFGCGPLTVDFDDLSVGAVSWDWDFGDGHTSSEQNPSHTYEQPGNYTVALTTSGGSCSKTLTKADYIQVIGPEVDFSSDIIEGCGPLTVSFTDNTFSGSPPTGWVWDFGDGATSTQQNPTHEYTSVGTYTVTLTVTDLDGCSRMVTKTDLIQVNVLEASILPTNVTCNGGSDGSIKAIPDEGLAPFTYQWNNGASTATISGLSEGNYSVIITDTNGCSITKSVEITEPLPAGLVTSNPSSVSHSSAELGGGLLSGLDCEQETGIVYATTSNPDISDSKVAMTLTADLFSEVVTGLQVNTTYYVRAYSTNQNGITTYGNEVTFTTSRKTLEITAVAGQNKIFDEADPVLIFEATGFEGGDDESVLTGALMRAAGENVGFYAIQLGSLDAGANYTIDFTSADFEIISADITGITFGDASVVYDGTAKSLAISGTLPAGTSVAYADNSRTDVGTQEATATITGPNYNSLVLTADLTVTPADITGVTFEDADFVFDGTAKSLAITGTLPDGTSVSYVDNSRTDVGSQEVTATLTGSNYNTLVLTADLTVTPADITGVTFEDADFVFDGTTKSLAITGTLPAGTSVAYADNSRTDVGTQEVSATITGSDYNTLVLTADLTVTPADITEITFEDGSFVFDGTEKSLVLTGTLPAGTSVAYTHNSRTDVGTQEMTATITGLNYNTLVLTADLTVTPADITDITFEDRSFVFDDTAQSLAITGTLPEGTSVTYANNTRTYVGIQEVTATITGSNYTTLILAAKLIITPATITGVTFADGNSVYDGTAKSLVIGSALPEGASVSYANNGQTEAGIYEVTATVSQDNYNDLVLIAELTIKKAETIITADALQTFIYDGEVRNIMAQLNHSEGDLTYNPQQGYSNAGNYEITVSSAETDNYLPASKEISLIIENAEIEGMTFEDKTFSYDGSEHSIYVSGLPEGANVSYDNNAQTEAGVYEVTATVNQDNYNDLVLIADLTIEKAEAAIAADAIQTFTYDGEVKDVAAQLNHNETVLTYTPQQGYTAAGTYDILVSSAETDNYLSASKEISLIIENTDIEGVTFEDETFTYDGSEHSIYVSGLPEGAEVSYANNSKINAGTYLVTATVSQENRTNVVLTARLIINKAGQEISFEELEDRNQQTDDYFQLDGISSSGLPVIYSYSYETEDPAATVDVRGFVRILSAGTITIKAIQEGNQNYEAAPPVERTLTIIGSEARLNSVTINGTMFSNPSEEIYYLIECGSNESEVNIQLEPSQGAIIDHEIEFTIATPVPGIYRETVTVTSEDGVSTRSYIIKVEKNFNFEDIVIQKFNNVLLVNNNPETNGGYRFVSYRWYKNGAVIGNGQYYSAGDDINDHLDPGSNYYVVLETEDGEVLKSCITMFQLRSSFNVALAPNPVRSGGTMELFADFPKEELETMELSIHNLNGVFLKKMNSKRKTTSITLPYNLQIGVYLLRIKTQNINKSLKFIVK